MKRFPDCDVIIAKSRMEYVLKFRSIVSLEHVLYIFWRRWAGPRSKSSLGRLVPSFLDHTVHKPVAMTSR